jgi:hypothetical protein
MGHAVGGALKVLCPLVISLENALNIADDGQAEPSRREP